MLPIHPEINELVKIPEFTHWLLIPETDRHYAFLKPIIVDKWTNRERLKEKGMRLFPIKDAPPNYPTKPVYKPR